MKVNKDGPYFVYVQQIYKHEYFDIDSFDRFRIACVHRHSEVIVERKSTVHSSLGDILRIKWWTRYSLGMIGR